MIFCNEQLLERVTKDILQRGTSATSNEQIVRRVTSDLLQRAPSDFTTSNKQRVNFNE